MGWTGYCLCGPGSGLTMVWHGHALVWPLAGLPVGCVGRCLGSTRAGLCPAPAMYSTTHEQTIPYQSSLWPGQPIASFVYGQHSQCQNQTMLIRDLGRSGPRTEQDTSSSDYSQARTWPARPIANPVHGQTSQCPA
jgi:hypothetical protein